MMYLCRALTVSEGGVWLQGKGVLSRDVCASVCCEIVRDLQSLVSDQIPSL